MIVLVDTDVLLDVALDRAPHVSDSSELLDWLEQQPGTGVIAWHTVSNLYYLLGGSGTEEGSRRFITDLLSFLQVAAGTADDVRFALTLPMKDFEDAMQVAAARFAGAAVIATRNIRHFARSPVPARRPAQIIRELTVG